MLADRPDLMLIRMDIPEPGRYYHHRRAIVLRRGLKIEEERRYLWHELTHAKRGDTSCAGWFAASQERSVEREAVRRAMPVRAMQHHLATCVDWHEFVWHMKVPEPWVLFRLRIAHPAEKAMLDAACRWSKQEWSA